MCDWYWRPQLMHAAYVQSVPLAEWHPLQSCCTVTLTSTEGTGVCFLQSRYWRCLQGLTQRLRFDPCTTHFPIPPLPHADPPVSRYNPQSPSTVPTKPAAHTTFSESAAAARGTALVSPASTDNNHHHHHHHHQQGVGDSRTDRGSTAKAPGGALGELRVTMPRLGSAEAVSSPTKAHSGQKSPHRRQFIRSKLQLGRFEVRLFPCILSVPDLPAAQAQQDADEVYVQSSDLLWLLSSLQ